MDQRVQTHCRFLLGKNNNETDHKIILTTPYVSAVKCCKFMFLEFSKAKSNTFLPLPWSMLKLNERTIHAQFVQKIVKTESTSSKKEVRWLIEINEFRTSVKKL